MVLFRGVIIVGLYWGINDRDVISGFVGALVGGFICGLIGTVIGFAASGIYWSTGDIYDKCTSESETYELIEYNTNNKNEKSYVYVNNADGRLITNVQYFDEDNTPQTVHLKSNFNYMYIKNQSPSVEITRYTVNENLWVYGFMSITPPPDYKIILPDSSSIYFVEN